MYEKLHTYFHDHVLKAYGDFFDAQNKKSAGQSSDLIVANHAATALYHFREHFPDSIRKSWKQLEQICPDYRLIGNVANASKHDELTRHEPLIKNADSVFEVLISTVYKDEQGEYMNGEKAVFVQLLDGTERNVLEVATNVMNMWCDELHACGVLKNKKHFEIKRKAVPTRQESSNNIDLNFTRGVGAKLQFRLQRYNYDTLAIEPVDLTGTDPKMRIYEKLYTADFRLVGQDGEYVLFEIQINDKQRKQLANCASEEELMAQFFNLAIDQGVTEGTRFKSDGTPIFGQDGKLSKAKVARTEKR